MVDLVQKRCEREFKYEQKDKDARRDNNGSREQRCLVRVVYRDLISQIWTGLLSIS